MKMPSAPNKPRAVELSRDRRNRAFLYRQLSDIIKQDIASGKFKPGDRLPSMDILAETYSVNKVTVRRALADLSAAGLIYSVPAQGTYVSEEPVPRSAERKQVLTVGLLSYLMVPGNTGLYHMEIIQGMRDELSKVQANLVILPVRNVVPQFKALEQVGQAGLDAVIYLGMFDPSSLRRMIENGPPAVLVDFSLRGSAVDTILLDNRGGAFQAMEHLLSLGHRRLAIIQGQEEQVATRERLEGVYEALDQAGVSRDTLQSYTGDFQREGGFRAMKEILDSGKPVPTGVFCFNDEMAAGALQALHAHSSLRCPRDISVIGFDDTAWATATQPPLTTIQVPKALMGRLAVQRILAGLRREEAATTTVLPTQIVARESTALFIPE
jgi:DNA-binding LacI/PurR family transcriptional regulator